MREVELIDIRDGKREPVLRGLLVGEGTAVGDIVDLVRNGQGIWKVVEDGRGIRGQIARLEAKVAKLRGLEAEVLTTEGAPENTTTEDTENTEGNKEENQEGNPEGTTTDSTDGTDGEKGKGKKGKSGKK